MNQENKQYLNIFVIVCTIILFIGVYYADKYSYMSDQGVVMTFFGILATFVVIGNYTQVSQIKNEMHSELSKNAENINKILSDMYDKDGKLRLQIKDTETKTQIETIVSNYWRQQDQRYSTLINELFKRIVNQDYVEMIKKITEPNGIYECKVLNPETNHIITATVRLEGVRIVFRNKQGKIVNDVKVVNEHDYNELEILDLVRLWKKISNPVQDEAVMQTIY